VGGVDAGPWIHLYAVTVGLAVVLPRLLLAVWARWRELRLAAGFALPLDAPYFRRALAGFSESATNIQVAPYSYTLGASEIAGLERLARHLFGDRARLSLRPNIPFGEELQSGNDLLRRQADIALTFAVFNASATPENENHGLFVDNLRDALDMPVALIADTAPYRQRLGKQAGAEARLRERSDAWRAFGVQRGVAVACIELNEPARSDLVAAGRDLGHLVGSALVETPTPA